MNELPIRFNAEMVRAILTGAKTQHRRPLKSQPPNGATEVRVEVAYGERVVTYRAFPAGGSARHVICACPFGAPGDKLWGREATRMDDWDLHERWSMTRQNLVKAARYVADGEWVWDGDSPRQWFGKRSYKPPMHMPREWSRITRPIKRVWVERVQDISEADAAAEGIPGPTRHGAFRQYGTITMDEIRYLTTRVQSYQSLWDSIYTKQGLRWDDNPLVAACEFELIEQKASNP